MLNKKFSSIVAIFTVAVAVFSAAKFARAETNSVTISEALINGPDGKEFIELYNPTDTTVNMSSWVLAYYSKDRDWNSPYRKKTFPSDSVLGPSEFFLISIKKGEYFKESAWNLGYLSYQLNNTDGAVGIFPDEDFSKKNAVDVLSWGEVKVNFLEGLSAPTGKSLEKIDLLADNKKGNWQESCEEGGTPGEEPETCETEPDSSPEDGEMSNPSIEDSIEGSSEKVYLNEIFPNPKNGSDDEYIEIVNGESGPVDLFGWTIRDASKSGKYVFERHTEIGPGEYFAIYRPESKIALNNSKESVYLHGPDGKITSSVSWEKSIKNSSYSFDNENWHWSKYLTPNKKNKFDSAPKVKIKKPKRAYKGLFTEFSVTAKDKETKKLKYVWDFGDGKKSYLKDALHKYLDTGKYTVTLAVADDSQTVEKSFSIKVKNYPRPDIEIVKIVPNPAGNDSENETIDLKNNSGKEIDLAGWKIATGSGEKIYNHPIIGEFSLEPNKTKAVTREFSKFSLGNIAGKVQLVMPDGKVIDEVEYMKEKIAEDEAYMKENDEWKWQAPGTKDENTAPEEDVSQEPSDDENGEVLGAMDETISASPNYGSRFTSEDAYIFLSKINFIHLPQEMNYTPVFNSSSTLAYLIASTI